MVEEVRESGLIVDAPDPVEIPELTDRQWHWLTLIEANGARETTLANQGMRVDPMAPLFKKMELLAEMLLDDDALTEWEIAFQEWFTTQMDSADVAIARAKLTAPGSIPDVPGNRAERRRAMREFGKQHLRGV